MYIKQLTRPISQQQVNNNNCNNI